MREAGPKELQLHIPGAQVVVLPEAAHSINWESSRAFNRNVLEFIRKH